MMTREDMLRELELLPVWQLRNPLPSHLEAKQPELEQAEPEQIAPVILINEAVLEKALSEKALPNKVEQVEAVIAPISKAEPQVLKSQVFRHVVSEDGDWLFVLANTAPQADEALLLRNIFMAMGIKTKPMEAPTITMDIVAATKPKLVIAMGEAAVKYLLQSTESLANLRCTIHAWQGVALVATYDLAHLLQVLPDKTKAWDDLCLAMQTLQRLKSVN